MQSIFDGSVQESNTEACERDPLCGENLAHDTHLVLGSPVAAAGASEQLLVRASTTPP
jgi:hypothetical protein